MDSLDELRSKSRNNIESIEVWLRRILLKRVEVLNLKSYPDTIVNGNNLYNSEIRNSVDSKFKIDPKRFQNPVNALFLPELIKIICKEDSFSIMFKDIFEEIFSLGALHLRLTLNKLIPIRNSLSHANPISLLDYYRTELTLYDITYCIKEYFKKMGVEKDYNAPTIIALSDSKGNNFSEDLIQRTSVGAGQCYPVDDKKTLQIGEHLIVEAIIDPSFDKNDYTILWNYPGAEITHNGNILVLDISGRHVNEHFGLSCTVTSKREEWHRMGNCDDIVYINYRVIPRK